MERRVSFYKNFGSKPEEIDLINMLKSMKEGAYHKPIETLRGLSVTKYGEAKKSLPLFTPSGTFDEKRSAENLSQYSHVIVLDIDNLGENANKIRDKSAEIEYTLAAFLSPGGKGVKILVNTDSTAEYHEMAYKQLVRYYNNQLNVNIDTSGKDVSRACFVSWDPEMYINENAKQFKILTNIENSKYSVGSNTNHSFKKAVSFTENKETYIEGNRNNFIHLLACNCNRYGLDELTSLELILTRYNGLPESEIKSTVHSAFNNIIEHGQYDSITATQTSVTYTDPSTTMVCSVFDLIKRNESEPEHAFIWNGIKEGSFGYVYGPPKSGKTVFCENLGMSIAAGKQSFMDFPIDQSKKRKVMFIGMEEFWRNRATRNKKQIDAIAIANPEEYKYIVVTEHFPGRLSTEEDWMIIEKIIITHEPDIVFIDSMTRTVSGEIEDSSTSRDASFRLRELVRKYNITLIMIHHTTKLHGDPLNLDKLAGSRVIAQEADFLYGINNSEGTRYIKEVATRYKAENENVTTFTINDNLWLEKINTTSEDYFIIPSDGRENPANEQLILDTIREKVTKEKPEVDSKTVFNAIDGAIKQTQYYAYLKKLEAKGKIKRLRGTISLIS